MGLPDIIIAKIRQQGPLSFHDFMEMCLYYPELGYYTSSRNRTDYYTSPQLSELFGMAIGRQLEEMWHSLGEGPFTVVEVGGGTGLLCSDILDYLARHSACYDQLTYCIVEKSAVPNRNVPPGVRLYTSLSALPPVSGCIFSNELLDNLSVHRVIMKDQLMEVFLGYEDGFSELLQPASLALQEYLTTLNIRLPEDFQTEINLDACAWIGDVAEVLKRGYVMTIDYGEETSRLYRARRGEGTLLCYHRNEVNDNPYQYIGEQDITAHVNFSALHHWGGKHGLHCCGFTDQARFLQALGWRELIQQMDVRGEDIVRLARRIAFMTHTLLLEMGRKLKILIQQKGLAAQPSLSGLKGAAML